MKQVSWPLSLKKEERKILNLFLDLENKLHLREPFLLPGDILHRLEGDLWCPPQAPECVGQELQGLLLLPDEQDENLAAGVLWQLLQHPPAVGEERHQKVGEELPGDPILSVRMLPNCAFINSDVLRQTYWITHSISELVFVLSLASFFMPIQGARIVLWGWLTSWVGRSWTQWPCRVCLDHW